MRKRVARQLFLKSTGQRVADADSVVPRALRKSDAGYTRVIIPPVKAGAKCSVQVVHNRNLNVKQRSFSNATTG